MTRTHQSTITRVNGHFTDQIATNDRGLAYGDGLFETIRVESGVPILLDAHLARLFLGCKRLGIDVDGLHQRISDDLNALLGRNSVSQLSVLKLIVTRGPGLRGYSPATGNSPTIISSLAPVNDLASQSLQGVRVRWCNTPLSINPYLAGIKHLNRLEQVLARGEWNDVAISEGLMCDPYGHLVEGTMSNVFWVSRGELYTPDLTECGIQGVVRETIIACAQRANIKVHMGRFHSSAILSASELFVCNSLINIWPVVALDEIHWQVGSLTTQLQLLLKKEYAV